MTSNLKEKLPSILENALQMYTLRGTDPVLSLGKEKYAEELCGHFIWKNGQQTSYLCPSAIGSGTVFTTREEALKLQPELAEKLAELEQNDQADPFAQQLGPLAEEAIVLFFPRKFHQKHEFLLDLELSDPKRAAMLKIFVIIDDHASAIVTLNLYSRGTNEENFCCGQMYCSVGKNAHLVLNEVQDFGQKTVCVRRKQTTVKEGGELHWNLCELGCAETYDSLDVQMTGEDSSAVVYGLYFPTKDQKMNLLTRQDHLVPRTFSNLHYKGALADRANARWEGMIYVDPKAEKTDGYQKNENLMLSDEANVLAEPGLEIITDDVKCSHGTTITNIDDDQIFYLTSRGIPQKEAEQLVIRGFFDTILNLITFAPIRGKLQDKIDSKMQEGK